MRSIILFVFLIGCSVSASTIKVTSTNTVPIYVQETWVDAAVTGNPTSVSVLTNGNASFSASGSGSLLSYYWKTNGTFVLDGGRISGAHTATITYTGVLSTGDNALSFACLVSNACDSVLSSAATLTITSAIPVINSFSANPSTISNGMSTTLSWVTSWDTNRFLTNYSGTVNGASSTNVTLTTNTDFRLVAQNPFGSAGSNITVTVTNGGGGGNGLLNNLLAYHAMEEGNGANRLDSTANGLDLTNAGTMDQTLTHIEGSAAATPQNGTSALTNGSASYKITGSFTEMQYFRCTGSLDGQQLIGRCCDQNAWEVGFGSGGTLPFFVRNATDTGYITVTSGVNLDSALNKWHVVFFGYDASGQTNWISVDGENKVMIQNLDGIRSVAQPLIAGGLSSSGITAATVALLDVHATWTRVLSQSDIATQINGYNFSAQSGTPLWLSSWQN